MRHGADSARRLLPNLRAAAIRARLDATGLLQDPR
jgi:hypothetical protein